MRSAVIGAAAICAAIAGAANAEPINPRDSVYVIGGYNNRDWCSAVAVGPRTLVTAKHCVDGELGVHIPTYDADRKVIADAYYKLKVIRTLDSYDQAIFEVLDPSVALKPVPICSTELAKEDEGKTELVALGYPKAYRLTETRGEFQSFENIAELIGDPTLSKTFYYTTVPVTGGNSGGGLFRWETIKDPNAADGKEWALAQQCLTGLATAGYRDYFQMTFFSTQTGLKALTSGLNLQTGGSSGKIVPSGIEKKYNQSEGSIDAK